MRSATLLFIFGLLAVASATKQVNVFAQMEAHPFGSSLLNLVQINMQANTQAELKSEDSINQITDLLNELQADMLNNKRQGDADHEDFQDQADADIDQFQSTLNSQLARKAATEAQLESDQESLAEAQDDLAAAEAHSADLDEQVEDANDENIAAKVAYDKKTSELEDAISATKDANVELAKLNQGAFIQGQQLNMVQLKSGMAKIESALEKHLPSRLAMYKPIINALIQMGTKADPALVAKVQGLITELQNTLEAELSTSQTAEQTRAADFEQLIDDLETDQDNTEDRIARDVTLINSLQGNIAANTDILESLNESIPSVQQSLNLRTDQKNDEQEQYEDDDANRVDELAVVQELIDYFQEKFATVSDYLRQRIAALDE